MHEYQWKNFSTESFTLYELLNEVEFSWYDPGHPSQHLPAESCGNIPHTRQGSTCAMVCDLNHRSDENYHQHNKKK